MQQHLDAHQRPPESIKAVYKKYQKMKLKELEQDTEIINLAHGEDSPLPANSKMRVVRSIPKEQVRAAFQALAGTVEHAQDDDLKDLSDINVYEHEDMPGPGSDCKCLFARGYAGFA